MSKILLNDVTLTYPVYGNSCRSIKNDLIKWITRKNLNDVPVVSVTALKNISFELNEGDYLGLIGHNGAGKSSLLRMLAGIYEVSEGRLEVEGSVSSLLGSSVGMLPVLTGYENIKINCKIHGYSQSQTEAVIADVVEFTELGDFLNLPVKMYSTGMQSRLAFAITTAVHPDILLLDEVVGTGDAIFINKAKNRMQNLLRKANILVLASHDTSILEKFCNKLMWLDHGTIKAYGNVQDVLQSYFASITQSA